MATEAMGILRVSFTHVQAMIMNILEAKRTKVALLQLLIVVIHQVYQYKKFYVSPVNLLFGAGSQALIHPIPHH